MSPRPLPNSYWVVPGVLLAGPYPLDELAEMSGSGSDALQAPLRRLLEAGFDTFIDLTEAGERRDYRALLPPEAAYLRSPIPDGSVAAVAQMRTLQGQLRAALAKGRRVYVHCRAGIGRTGMVIGCHLVEEGRDGASALEHLNRLWQQSARCAVWPSIPQTHEQTEYVLSWTPQRERRDEEAALSTLRGLRERYLGCLLGLACGDALGISTQFMRGGGLLLTDLVGGGAFDLPRGSWSDDTALALCVADSLLGCDGFDPVDQLARFERWQQQGERSATGECIGITAGTARRLQQAQAPPPRGARPGRRASGDLEAEAAPLSRTAPIVLYGLGEPRRAIEQAALAARNMGASLLVADACRALAAMLWQALRGAALEQVLSPPAEVFAQWPLEPTVAAVLRAVPPPSGLATGTSSAPALMALGGARWALCSAGSFRDGALRAANLGGDADVTTAVYGALAGAMRGVGAIPQGWLACLAQRAALEELADRLLTAALVGLAEGGESVADSRPAIG
jgi:ADP-ribosylglycohydrolase